MNDQMGQKLIILGIQVAVEKDETLYLHWLLALLLALLLAVLPPSRLSCSPDGEGLLLLHTLCIVCHSNILTTGESGYNYIEIERNKIHQIYTLIDKNFTNKTAIIRQSLF